MITEDEMIGWHHRLKGHELEQSLENGEGQGSLECCSPWCHSVGHDLGLNNNSKSLLTVNGLNCVLSKCTLES